MTYPHVQHICNITIGGDVLHLASTGHGTRHLINCIERLEIEGATIRRTRGAERVTFANGNTLHFATLRTLDKTRGLNVWQIVTDDHTILDDPEVRATLHPIFNHPLGGQIERYTVIG